MKPPWTSLLFGANKRQAETEPPLDQAHSRPAPYPDPPRRLRGLGRLRNDGQPGPEEPGRRLGPYPRQGAGGRPCPGLRPEQDRRGARQPAGEPGRRGNPLAVEHGLPRGHDRHFRGLGRHRPATRRRRFQLPARPRGIRHLRDVVLASLGDDHRRSRTLRRFPRNAGPCRDPHRRDHGHRRRTDQPRRRHLAPPRRPPDGRGDHRRRLPQDRLPWHPDAERLPPRRA